MEGLGEEGEKSELGGLDSTGPAGGAFRFADWEGGEVAFIGTSTRSSDVQDEKQFPEVGLSSLWEWIDDNM